ncbi:MerR family transcriptional regulator [Nocardioides agariphilus]|uniref:MerR family transcriptional regulator n=1 Tax=Nocardioides agariphilus TaxID=433664 RepID=A0A930VR43_9ACTN|nr:MerR family transcriptional regulator [Nocardioides agariphilus]MBF4769341.1 MerR family transcriptional regulator [Nocardioides agariphilus]
MPSEHCTVGEAARSIGVSDGTIRLWEQQGLVHPVRDSSGRRQFSQTDLDRLRKIAWWRRVRGLNAAAIRRVLESEDYANIGNLTAPRLSEEDASGARLRAMRRNAGLTLKDISLRSGLSVSFISSVERGVSRPSPTAAAHLLASLTDADDFAQETEHPIHHLGDGKRVDIAPGITYEWLSTYRGLIEPQLAVVQPGAHSESTYQHDGEEFLLILAGTLDLRLDDSARTLRTQDSIHFSSQVPHAWVNPGTDEAHVLWITTERGVWASRGDAKPRDR